MRIHRFEKLWLGAAFVLIVAFIATIVYGSLGPGVAMVGDDGGTVNPDNPTAADNFRDPGVYQADDDSYDVYVEARQFAFSPGTSEPIRVPADTNVTFHITSGDVTHGFELVGTNVNTMVIPGQVAQLTVNFDEARTHHIVCHEYCGPAHHAMEGSIEVVPQSEFTPPQQAAADQSEVTDT
ncbi:cytochrome c oxidase subunit II [Halobacterium salinarum]|uniref:cytochrome c oxidase subunit II n=1 Tax=Halobacterium TaxID=2239 RepID=UPI0025566532|nr:cytochrome c oxidase subunit II [Halobacterium salinarum]MDL0140135.1 cytochrome c oxidase subunit II [Halobacterium salinarum]